MKTIKFILLWISIPFLSFWINATSKNKYFKPHGCSIKEMRQDLLEWYKTGEPCKKK